MIATQSPEKSNHFRKQESKLYFNRTISAISHTRTKRKTLVKRNNQPMNHLFLKTEGMHFDADVLN